MTTKVQSAGPSTPLSDVIQAMKECPHSCLVITDNEIPVGIITERDVVRLVGDWIGNRISLAQPIRDIMSQPIVTIGANASLSDALVIAKSKKLRHLPVDNAQRKLVGLVTQSDLVTAQYRIHEMQTKILEREVINRTQESVDLNRRLTELSREDPLLKIANFRAMEADITTFMQSRPAISGLIPSHCSALRISTALRTVTDIPLATRRCNGLAPTSKKRFALQIAYTAMGVTNS